MPTENFDVRYVAALVRLELTDEEASTYQQQLDKILDHMRRIDAIDVSGIEPTAHANPVFDVMREDEPGKSFSPETALRNAPKQRNDQFVVTKVVE